MTTQELINQYVTAHADNRWMDASELEALLTEFAEKLKEPASEDLEQAANDFAGINYDCESESDAFYHHIQTEAFKAGAQWQREQMMKDAIEGEVIEKGDFIKFADDKYIDLNPTMGAEPFIKLEDGDKVKVIIIKE